MRAKMDRSNRAKQFIPFSPLNGLEEALEAMEAVKTDRILLAEDAQLELDAVLHTLRQGDRVSAVYYGDSCYRELCDELRALDLNSKTLLIGEKRIAIADLLAIELQDRPHDPTETV